MHNSFGKLLLGLGFAGFVGGTLAGCDAPEAAQQEPADHVAQTAAPIPALTYDVAGERLLKVQANRLEASADGGANWQAIPLPSLQAGQLTAAATPATDENALYIAGPGVGVQRTENAGEAWEALNDGLPSTNVTAFSVHRTQPQTLFAYIPKEGIYRSEDAGEEWRKVDSGPTQGITQFVHSDLEGSMQTGWLFAASDDDVRISMDCFCGWRPGEVGGGKVHAVTYDPRDPQRVYAAAEQGIYQSSNGGQDWARVEADGGEKIALVFAPTGELYAAARDGEVSVSRDQGRSWETPGG